MSYYTVTVVSPCGVRDTFGVEAASERLARENVQFSIIMTRPNWRVVSVKRLY